MYGLSNSAQLSITTHIERQQMKTQAKSADTILMKPGLKFDNKLHSIPNLLLFYHYTCYQCSRETNYIRSLSI
jgi:hypothetical protein